MHSASLDRGTQTSYTNRYSSIRKLITDHALLTDNMFHARYHTHNDFFDNLHRHRNRG